MVKRTHICFPLLALLTELVLLLQLLVIQDRVFLKPSGLLLEQHTSHRFHTQIHNEATPLSQIN